MSYIGIPDVKVQECSALPCQYPTKRTEKIFQNLLMDPVRCGGKDESATFRRCMEDILREMDKKIKADSDRLGGLQKQLEFAQQFQKEWLEEKMMEIDDD